MPKLTPAQMKAAIEEFKKKFTPGYYHGSPSPSIKAFDPNRKPNEMSAQTMGESAPRGAIFVTPEPEFSHDFLFVKMDPEFQYKTGSTIYPVSINKGKHLDPSLPENLKILQDYIKLNPNAFPKYMGKKDDIQKYYKNADWDIIEDKGFLDHIKKLGFDSFTIDEGGVKNIGIFDPKNIRGKFAKYNPEDAESPNFMKAEGGAVQNFQVGGLAKLGFEAASTLPLLRKLGLSEESIAAWKAANSINQRQTRNPILQQAAKDLAEGKITSEQYRALARTEMPIRAFTEVPSMPTQQDIANALKSNQLETGIIGVNKMIAPGSRVSSRLDIPAYDKYDKWIVSLHDPLDAGKSIGYGQTAHLKGPIDFTAPPKAGHAIATGKSDKTTYARIHGDWEPTDPQDVYKRAQDLMGDPQWSQVGLNPFRHSYFYDKADMAPVVAGEEALQVGPLVLVKKPQKVDPDDPRFRIAKDRPETFAAGGVAKKALEHARSLPFVHFSKAPSITYLEPGMYGTGIKGAEASRLANAPDIKPRSYFYVDKPGVRPEQGLGPHKYQGVAEGIYPLHEDPMGFSAIAKQKSLDPYLMSQGIQQVNEAQHLNELERLIKQAGYRGYANDDVGLLFERTPVKKAVEGKAGGGKIGALESLAKKILPAAEREANKAKFLEGTKVVDQNGKPITMYHHTKDFQGEAFDPALAQAHDSGYHGKGMYFGSKDYLNRSAYGKHSSGNVAGQTGFEEGSQVIPVNLAIKNPKYIDVADQSLYGMPIEKLKQQGYDGVIVTKDASFKNAMGRVVPRKEVYNAVAFEPTQIKSTIGNTGTYNPLDPSLVKKKGGSV